MNDVMSIINKSPSECFEDVDKTICELVRYIDKLEDRISELEEKMVLIEDRSDLLQSSEERYYN